MTDKKNFTKELPGLSFSTILDGKQDSFYRYLCWVEHLTQDARDVGSGTTPNRVEGDRALPPFSYDSYPN